MNIIPLIILGAFSCVSLGLSMAKHGEHRFETENAWVCLIAQIINMSLICWAVFG